MPAALVFSVIVAIALALLVVGLSFAGSPDRIAAGVRVSGVNVGGLTLVQAEHKLEQVARKASWTPVVFNAGGRRFKVMPVELGVRADWAKAVVVASRDGDGVGPLRGFKRLKVRLFGVDIAPRLEHSQPALTRFLNEISKAVDHPAVEPALVIHGARLSIAHGRQGKVLDRPAAAQLIVSALASLDRSQVTLPLRVDTPTVRESDLEHVLGEVKTAVSGPVLLDFNGVRWRISPGQINRMLVFPSRGESRLKVGGEATLSYLGNMAKSFDKPPKDAGFLASGASIRVSPSRPGRAIDRERTANAILRAALSTGPRIADVVIKQTQPKRATAEVKAMAITGLVGSYETEFTGTANRIHNVDLVAKLIDNTLIAPGAVFSFNETTGERTAQKGFLTAPVIINGEVSEGLGGGVCQVSTTVFNAAFEAGLDITERTNHALYISHYPLGRDATVNWPTPDLKFVNDTGHWLLLKTFASSYRLLVAFYGTPQHRRVVATVEPLRITGAVPVQTIPDPTLAVGTTVVESEGEPPSATSVHRRVYDSSGKLIHNDTWYSTYRSSPKVERVGTKKPVKPPSTTNTTTTQTTTATTTDTTATSTEPVTTTG